MANMELIEAKTSTSSSVTFSSIPQTYTDLKLVCSTRQDGNADGNQLSITFNGSSSGYSRRLIFGYGSSYSTAGATSEAFARIAFAESSTYTSNTFNNFEIYIPNYTSANYKSFSSDAVSEGNTTTIYAQALYAGLWSNTAAITSLTISDDGSTGTNFASGSTFYLYGISNVTSTTKATGGIVSSDGTYWYHMFPYSSTFTPTQSLTADVLCIAGGGAANAGGGGAGGVLYSASQSLSTAQTITIGAGGAGVGGGYPVGPGGNGVNTSCGSLIATGGGGGGGYNDSPTTGAGSNGGSGGGAGTNGVTAGVTANAGTGTVGQGNNGGTSTFGSTAPYSGAGGGGAGGVGGTTAAANRAGLGGTGTVTFASWANATQTGVNNGYYAGGGGGGSYGVYSGSYPGTGGLGGGGAGAAGNAGTNGLANTGGGGGGGNAATSASGGSGLVIIRYAI
jgi:hypothetical protein